MITQLLKNYSKQKQKKYLQVINPLKTLDFTNGILETKITLFYCFHYIFDIWGTQQNIYIFFNVGVL